ncbi:TolC family protein [Comamonas endophytica]|uniref:TolC family protein n=1 Tax=Comamonas endophytica TaxID=2949090 RepID=A0ABY6G9T8_9BURK|nr:MULTISPECIES: TolC family protein [unclassified Acidovorax]MCD2512006.1 TolC family protein [Acidovorax sp. D4N7]UYG51785.1 TolC family protein [Acidovorax sp. 5MLIR]
MSARMRRGRRLGLCLLVGCCWTGQAAWPAEGMLRVTRGLAPASIATAKGPITAASVASADGSRSVAPVVADAAAPAPPRTGRGLALRDAVQQGLERNPAVRSAMARLGRSGTEVEIARAGYHPNVQAGVGTAGSNSMRLGYDVLVTQMLYDWGAVESQIDSARATERHAAHELLVAREDAALQVSESYFDALFARRRAAVVDGYMERLQALLELSQRRVSTGYVDRSEAGRVTLALARAEEQRQLEQGKLQEALQQYALLVGSQAQDLEEPPLMVLDQMLGQGRHLSGLITRAPLYLQAVEKSRIEEANIQAADAALKPQLNLEGSVQRREIGGQLTRDSTLMLRLRMAAFQGLSNFRRVDAARQALEAAQWDRDQVERDIRGKVQTLLEGEAPLAARDTALRAQIEGADEIGGIYREQFLVGMRSMVDLLSVESDRFEAERQWLQLQSERQRLPLRAMAQLGLLVPLLEDRIAEKMLP